MVVRRRVDARKCEWGGGVVSSKKMREREEIFDRERQLEGRS